jgi:hypothetical protein
VKVYIQLKPAKNVLWCPGIFFPFEPPFSKFSSSLYQCDRTCVEINDMI